MKQFIYLLSILSVLFLSNSVFADGLPSGSYKQTCLDIKVENQIGHFNFTAKCNDLGGNPRQTNYIAFEVPANNWSNLNGNLYRRGTVPGGSWLKSCTGSGYDSTSNTLAAYCKNLGGNYQYTKIQVPPSANVWNKNGKLVRH